MKTRRLLQFGALALLLILLAGVVVPRFNADRYRLQIQSALETALGRKVTFGEVRFTLLTGPGFTLRDVTVAEDPALGFEPVAYVDTLIAQPRILSLLTGHLAFASLRLETAHLNLARADLPNGEYRWNLEPLLRPAIVAAFPNITIRGARLNFKAADVKSVVYLLDCDLAIEPPSGAGAPWRFRFEGKPARADRPARGSGLVRAHGTWRPGSLDANLQLDRSELGDVLAIVRGEDAGLHGLISGNARFAGPLDRVAVEGKLRVEELHGWDQDIPRGEVWPLEVHGQWNAPGQQLELDAVVAGKASRPVTLHYLVERYLTQPRWGVSVAFASFPTAPLLPLARDLGLSLPPGLEIGGTLDGMVSYSGSAGYRGQARIQQASLKFPDSNRIQVPEVQVMVGDGIARLLPTWVLHTAEAEAVVAGEYNLATGNARFSIGARNLDVAALGSQVSSARVPVLSSVREGQWSGALLWVRRAETSGDWSGGMQLSGVEVALPALAKPVRIESAQCRLERNAIAMTRIRGRVGDLTISGEYRYDPEAQRPHRFHLNTGEVEASALEALLQPALKRYRGVLGVELPFSRQSVPEWLATLHTEGTLQMQAFSSGDFSLPNVRSRIQWDGAGITVSDIAAPHLAARLEIDIAGKEPRYHLTARLLNQPWKGGSLSVETSASALGTGSRLMRSMEATGTFSGTTLEDDLDRVSGRYDLTWRARVPRLLLSAVQLQSAAETYTGRGNLQDDGTLLLQLTSANKQAKLIGGLSPETPFRWTSP